MSVSLSYVKIIARVEFWFVNGVKEHVDRLPWQVRQKSSMRTSYEISTSKIDRPRSSLRPWYFEPRGLADLRNDHLPPKFRQGLGPRHPSAILKAHFFKVTLPLTHDQQHADSMFLLMVRSFNTFRSRCSLQPSRTGFHFHTKILYIEHMCFTMAHRRMVKTIIGLSVG